EQEQEHSQNKQGKAQKSYRIQHFVLELQIVSVELELIDDRVDLVDTFHYHLQSIVLCRMNEVFLQLPNPLIRRNYNEWIGKWKLKSLYVEDLFQQSGEEYRYIAQSQAKTSTDGSNAVVNDDLLSMEMAIKKGQRNAPHLQVQCELNPLQLCWNPNTMALLIQWAAAIVSTKDPSFWLWWSSKSEKAATSCLQVFAVYPMSEHAEWIDAIQGRSSSSFDATSGVTSRIHVCINDFGLTLNTSDTLLFEEPKGQITSSDIAVSVPLWNRPSNYRPVARILSMRAHADMHSYRTGLVHVCGELTNLTCKDLRAQTLLNFFFFFFEMTIIIIIIIIINIHINMYENIFGLKEKDFPIAKFEYKWIDKGKGEEQEPRDYSCKLDISINPMRFVYLQSFIIDMHCYMKSSVLDVLLSVRPITPHNTITSHAFSSLASHIQYLWQLFLPERVAVDFKTIEPVVIIPVHRNSPRHVEFNLGTITLTNATLITKKTFP
ncbi:hypothetical protein RFI_15062, partial [Reticulomyxa filosa]